MSHGGWRPHIESALRLDVGRMIRDGAIHPDSIIAGSWQWTRDGEVISTIGYRSDMGAISGTLTLDYRWTDPHDHEVRDVSYSLALESTPCRYGGRRWWVRCPYTGRRALKLYKFCSIEKFCHRLAIRPRPTYASQRTSGSERVMAQRWAIRRKLGDDGTLFDPLARPKGMHVRTFARLEARDEQLAEREWRYLGGFLARMMARDGDNPENILA